MTIAPELLVQHCAAIVEGAAKAIDWVEDVRPESPRLDRDAAGLIERLRRSRNTARRLGAASSRPMAVGFFGLSQAGKSYLISALARGENGALETVMDGQRLNFIAHINPTGGGKEATGLVTRFTRHGSGAPKGFPVALTLFSEADVIKILGNSFFLDFDQQRVAFCSDQGEIRRHLAALEKKARPRPTGGLNADDVVDLMDYFVRRFPKSMEAYQADFWPTATDLAPRLDATDRAVLFSLLWGGIEELTSSYLKLCQGLAKLGYALNVFAELGTLVRETEGGLSQADSIVNVDMLARLGRDDDDTVQVISLENGKPKAPVALPRSLLAALAREMTFELAEPPMAAMLENVDLLDFPGYRGRLRVANLKEVAEKLEGRDPVAELILRGKVAYLFERYTDDQEMNVLVLCTPCHKQSDVNDLGPALETWITTTQGKTPDERARRKPGLVWAMTMFDNRLLPRPDETLDLIRSGWNGMMRLTLLEKFEQFEWVNAWQPGKPFDNVFLVRKPGMAAGVIETEGKQELQIVAAQKDRLREMRQTFLDDATVKKYIRTPDEAWDAMLTLDDGGMARLSAYLGEVARLDVKLGRIQEQISHIVIDLSETQLGSYYRADGADAVAQKKKAAEAAINALSRTPQTFGEVLHALQPSAEHLRALYLRAEAAADVPSSGTGNTTTEPPPPAPSFISLDLGGFGGSSTNTTSTTTKPAPASGRAVLFAKSVLSDWTRRMRALPANADMQRFLALPESALQIIVDEIVTAAARFRLEESLVAALQHGEDEAATTRSRLVGRQVMVAWSLLCDFVDQLGFSDIPLDRRPVSSRVPDHRLFEPPAPVVGLPMLNPTPVNFSAIAIFDWFDAFTQTAIGNAGHAAGGEFTPDQNERLGAIIAQIKGGSAACTE